MIGFVDAYGWALSFFSATAAIGLPVLLLVWLAGRADFRRANGGSNAGKTGT